MQIALSPGGSGPLYRQLFEVIREAILEGSLRRGQKLAPTRVLASELDVSRNTVNTAYEMLGAEGYVVARQGSGYFVSASIPDAALQHVEAKPLTGSRPRHELSSRGRDLAMRSRPVPEVDGAAFQRGLPALDEFPFRQWQQSLDRHSRNPALHLLKYQDQGGLPELKAALLDYLTLARGVRCGRDQIIIVSGGQAALDLIARLLIDDGDVAGIENPGYLGARDAFRAAGAELAPINVDEAGIVTSQLRDDLKLVYSTPSYQFPLGVTMSATRRLQLLQWARATDGYVIEDDYDSEYRYRGRPLSSLQGIDEDERVIYMGTLSKVMFPSLRLGYIVAPQCLAPSFAAALRKTGQDAPLLLQAAVADFIRSGHLVSHIRRMRKLYAERQATFVELSNRHLADWLRVTPTDAGMQLACDFRQRVDEKGLVERAESRGLDIGLLSSYYLGSCPAPGLFLGYAGVPVEEMEKHILVLAQILEASVLD
jgi:GntR family transcriptional regulator/MocR family aminotransferase